MKRRDTIVDYSDRYAIRIHLLCEANREFRTVKLGAVGTVVLYRV